MNIEEFQLILLLYIDQHIVSENFLCKIILLAPDESKYLKNLENTPPNKYPKFVA